MSEQDDQSGDQNASPADSEEKRVEERIELWLHGATLREPGCSAAPVTVHDLSRSGFRVPWPYRLRREATIYLKLPGFEIMPAKVAWCDNFEVGGTFDRPLSDLVYERIVAANVPGG